MSKIMKLCGQNSLSDRIASLMPPENLHRDCAEFRRYSNFTEFGEERYTVALTKIDQSIVQIMLGIYVGYYENDGA